SVQSPHLIELHVSRITFHVSRDSYLPSANLPFAIAFWWHASRITHHVSRLPHHILRPHLQTFILILPHHRRIELQQLRRKLVPCSCQQGLGVFSRAFVSPIITTRPLSLIIIPMRHGMHRRIFQCPLLQLAFQRRGNLFEWNQL